MDRVCLPRDRVRDLLQRMDVHADSLIAEGTYYKKILKEIKEELK